KEALSMSRARQLSPQRATLLTSFAALRLCVMLLFRVSAACLCTLLLFTAPVRGELIEADLVLRGGTLCDGSGAEPAIGDLAVKGDRIVAIGNFETGKVGLEIDCRGMLIAPGFIDLHNHSDAQVVDRLTRGNVNFLMQGCTTVVTGNCGS